MKQKQSKKNSTRPNRLEQFETVVIKRSEIKEADYNPRYISEAAEKKLRKFLRKNGLWSPLTANKKTMTLVSGHQRLAAMDAILKKPDYKLTVALIDVDEQTEVEGNIFMNNPAAQGEWDTLKLADIHEIFPDIDFEKDLGFDESDIDIMFGFNDFSDKQEEIKEQSEELSKDHFREVRKKMRENMKNQTSKGDSYDRDYIDYALTIVFPNNEAKRKFMRDIKKPEKETHVKASVLYDIQSGKYKIN